MSIIKRFKDQIRMWVNRHFWTEGYSEFGSAPWIAVHLHRERDDEFHNFKTSEEIAEYVHRHVPLGNQWSFLLFRRETLDAEYFLNEYLEAKKSSKNAK